jgi:asparagine synthase (glutamine-hydrolysing)
MLDQEWIQSQSNLSDHLKLELTEHSLPLLLRYEDRNSMAFSIEARVPFLDHRLVEFVFRRAGELRIHKGWTKWIHRRALDPLLPKDVCWRRDKVGFEIPEGRWLRENRKELRGLFVDGSPVGDYLDLSVARREIDGLSALEDGRSAQSARIWRWTNLALWLKTMAAGAREPLSSAA